MDDYIPTFDRQKYPVSPPTVEDWELTCYYWDDDYSDIYGREEE
jgi:hypothetical protein